MTESIATASFHKVCRVGTIKIYSTRRSDLFIRIQYTGGNLSITGVEGPLKSGNAAGGCGQIDMHYAHRDPAHDDKRNEHLIQASDIKFATGWNAEMWLDLGTTYLTHQPSKFA